MNYQRGLHKDFISLLAHGGALNSLVQPQELRVGNNVVPLSSQFRKGNRVSIYLGETALLHILYKAQSNTIVFESENHRGLFPDTFLTTYPLDSQDQLMSAIAPWPGGVLVNVEGLARHVEKEGKWQAALAERFGRNHQVGDPWCIIDTQAVIEGAGSDEAIKKSRILDWEWKRFERLRGHPLTHDELKKADIKPPRDGIRKADAIGVSRQGDMVIMEVKPADANPSEVYSSPIQLAGYVDIWAYFIGEEGKGAVCSQINELIEQKKAVGLLPENAPSLHPNFSITPVLSICGERSTDKVESALQIALDIAKETTGDHGQLMKLARFDTLSPLQPVFTE